MGQKTNPNVFRLGKLNEWKYEYFEKKSNESAIYTFKNLEIEDFITRFLKIHGLSVHEIKLYHFNDVLHIFISYFLTQKAVDNIKLDNKSEQILLTKKPNRIERKYYINRVNVKNNIKKYVRYEELNYKKSFLKTIKPTILGKAKRVIKKIKRINFLKYYKKNLLALQYNNILNIKTNSFLEKFLESLSLFTNKQTHIALTFKQLNKNIKQSINEKNQKLINKKLIKLRKYEKNNFFKEGMNVLFICICNKGSAIFLSKFISTELTYLKKHRFFLKFIQTILKLFINKTFSNCTGIKIQVKGRFNGAPRARHRFIRVGKGVPALTINSKINYGETTSFTPNGTFGVKVWIH
jgi:hypothetical protein